MALNEQNQLCSVDLNRSESINSISSINLKRKTLINSLPVESSWSGEFDFQCDVCVVGAGTAGAIAAIAAAKRGHSVIICDSAPIAGGSATAACVWDYYYGSDGGLYSEVNADADSVSDIYLKSTSGQPGSKRSYTTAQKSLALAKFFDKYNIKAFYSSYVTDVFVDSNKVCGVAIHDGEQTITISAAVVIDGAEGAVCRLLGLNTLGGRVSDGKSARFSRTVGVMSGGYLLGRWRFCGDFAGADTEKAARLDYEYAAEPPCSVERLDERCRLYSLGYETGRREVPCIETEQVYLFSDYLDGKRPDGAIFYTTSPLDNANPDLWNEDEDFQDWQLLCDMHAYGVSVGVTPKMLIPKGVDCLLVAGKHIGTGHTMTSTVRMKSDMEKCGEAAGVIASLTIEYETTTFDIADTHIDKLRGILGASGCYNPENDRGICDLNDPTGNTWKSCHLPVSTEELREALSSIHPSLGLISVRLGLPDRVNELLRGFVDAGGLLRENAAIGLGLLRDESCIPVLHEILDGGVKTYLYESPVKYQYPWLHATELCNYIKAVCLIGRFGRADDRPRLEKIAAYSGDDPHLTKAAEYARAALKSYDRQA